LEEDEHEPLLGQPSTRTQMRYGSGSGRRRGAEEVEDGGQFIRSSSYFGFLERAPFRWGSRGMRYQPSIADLQENPGRKDEEELPIAQGNGKGKHRRKRSNTVNSGHTTDSLSSRGDIFPSEDEMDDAIAIDDEFAFDLGRRLGDETPGSSSRRETGQRSTSMLSVLTISSRDSAGSKQKKNTVRQDVLMGNVRDGLLEYPQEEHEDPEVLEYRISLPTSPQLLQRTPTSSSIISNPLEHSADSQQDIPTQPEPPSPSAPASFNAAALPRFH